MAYCEWSLLQTKIITLSSKRMLVLVVLRLLTEENGESFKTGTAEPKGQEGAQCVEMKLRWQYMPWNLLLIIVLNNFWYFKHQTLTRICSEACLKHNWRFVFEKSKKLQFKKTISSILFQICFWVNPRQDLVFEISKII